MAIQNLSTKELKIRAAEFREGIAEIEAVKVATNREFGRLRVRKRAMEAAIGVIEQELKRRER